MEKDQLKDALEVNINNVLKVTEDNLNGMQKKLYIQAVDNYKAACLQSFSFLSNGDTIQKTSLPTPCHVVITEDPHKVPRYV